MIWEDRTEIIIEDFKPSAYVIAAMSGSNEDLAAAS